MCIEQSYYEFKREGEEGSVYVFGGGGQLQSFSKS